MLERNECSAEAPAEVRLGQSVGTGRVREGAVGKGRVGEHQRLTGWAEI